MAWRSMTEDLYKPIAQLYYATSKKWRNMEDNFKRKNIAILRCPMPPEEALQVGGFADTIDYFKERQLPVLNTLSLD